MPRLRFSGRLFLAGILALVGIWFALGGAGAPAEDEPVAPAIDPGNQTTADGPRAVRLLAQARQACAALQDYRCTLATRERLRGHLPPEQVMDMEFRVHPFAVRLCWRQPATSIGQEVRYAVGLNDGKMRVRPAGYLGSLVGVMALDPHAPSVRENSRHAITDAGIGNMLEEFAAPWEGRPAGCAATPLTVRLGASTVDGKPCRRIEVVLGSTESVEWQRGLIHIDQESGLPVRVEYYDTEGRLLDEATYRGLELNVGLGDAVFSR